MKTIKLGKKEVRVSVNAECKCGYLVEYREYGSDGNWLKAKVWSKGADDYYRVFLTQYPYAETERIYLQTLLVMYYMGYTYRELDGYNVHHINGIKKCNDLINLLPLKMTEHRRLHYYENLFKRSEKPEDYAKFIEYLTPFVTERDNRLRANGAEFVFSVKTKEEED